MNKQVLGLGLAMLACAGALYIPAKTLADDDFDMGAINDWAKDYSGGIGFEESSGGDGVRMSGTDTEVNQSEIFPDMESDREQEMADRMADSYGDDEAFSAHAQEFSTELSQHPDTSQGDAYDLVMGSVRSEGGAYEVESHGCTITRSPAGEMVYHPDAPNGSRVSGHEIIVDEETCQGTYYDNHGALCTIVDTETECAESNNTRVVESEPVVYQYGAILDHDTGIGSGYNVQVKHQYAFYVNNRGRHGIDTFGSNFSSMRAGSAIYLPLQDFFDQGYDLIDIHVDHGARLGGPGDAFADGSEGNPTIFRGITEDNASERLPRGVTEKAETYYWVRSGRYYFGTRDSLSGQVTDATLADGSKTTEFHVQKGGWTTYLGWASSSSRGRLRGRMGIYNIKVFGFHEDQSFSGDTNDLEECYRLVSPQPGDHCKQIERLTLSPSVAQQELGPLWSHDDQSNVCWLAGSRATCEIETEEPLDINMDSLFDDDGFNVELEALMGDCELVEREVTNTTTTSYMERGDCSIPQQPIFEPCTLTREYETTKDEDGNITSVSPIWSGSSRCQRIADNIDDHPECDYSIEYGSSSCIVADGEQICSCEDEGTQETLVWDDWAHGNGPLINEDVEDAHAYFTDSHELIIDGIGTLNISLSDFSGVETHTEYEFTGNVRSVSDNTVQINGEIVEIEQCPIITYLEESSQFFDPYSSTVEISEIVCPTPNDTTCTTEQDSDGNTHEVCFAPDQVETACAGMIADGENDCQLTERRCAFTSVHPLGEYCAEEETLYECEITTAWEDSQVEEVMDCGDGEFYCVDGSCLDPDLDQGNDGFGEAAAMLTAVQQMEQDMDCEDPEDLSTCKFFSGDHAYCRQGRGSFSSVWDCCDLEGGEDEWGPDAYIGAAIGIGMMVDPDMESVAELMGPVVGDQVAEEIAAAMSGIGTAYLAYQVISGEMLDNFSNLLQLAIPCYPREYELDMAGDKSSRHYLGKRCGKSIDVGFSTWCIRRDRHYCSWDGPVGRIITGEANKQLGRDFGTPRTPTCEGLSLDDMETINWSELDLSEWEDILRRTGNMPPRDDFGEVDVDSQVEGVPENPGGVDPL